jgi:MFS family permease
MNYCKLNIFQKIKSDFSVIFTKNMLLVSIMNFVGVIPYYMTGSTLMIWLRDEGFSLSAIGLVSVLNIPHAVKFLWSHLFDSISIPVLSKRLGLRRSWLIVCNFLAAIMIFAISFVNPINDFYILCVMAFVANIFISSQNILCLALQMEIIPKDVWGPSEAMNVLGFRTGVIFSCAGSLFLSEFVSWSLIYKIIPMLMLPGILLVCFARLDNSMKEPFVKYTGSIVEHFKKSISVPMREFFKTPGSFTLLFFMIFYSLHDHLLSSMHKIFHLSIGFSKSQVAFVDNTFGMFMTLLGGFLSGMCIKKYGSVRVMKFGSIISIFVGLGLVFQNYVGKNIYALYFTVAIQEIVHGFTMTSFFTYQMGCCSIKFAVSQLSLLKALDALGKYFFGSMSGILVQILGWNNFFVMIALSSIPGIIIMNVVPMLFQDKSDFNSKSVHS